ncbi:aliphatic sulfonate ABC transporter substrate-binding protein [Algihabitans albus]|uniref:aliphatic sulfonate ABC transporter substrate-binding protein n=1 Tax=Algihabitans albus TaxID=2164067 RepID=UPI000E5D3362|nr:aliphatic sulfonate ABC transporter substrate-binding protein [Algihabitans albus]
MSTRRSFLSLAAAAIATAGLVTTDLIAAAPASAAETPERIGIDWAYYNPVAILLKNKGWLEEEFAEDETEIRWVLSLGSNKALEFLRGGSIDFGSTAGSAAIVGRASGLPIKAVYAYSKPEWTALVVRRDSEIQSVADLRGKTVAVTRGTDPHIFLLRALAEAGLSEDDIKPVLLQHPDGYRALERGQVDAWAGLDPHMAKAELESDARLFFRNADLNTYGILNVREAFAQEYPETVARVLRVYERARRYALENPQELQAGLVAAAKIDPAVAARQLEQRTDITDPAIGQAHRETFLATGRVLQEIGVIDEDLEVGTVVDELIDASFLTRQAAKAGETAATGKAAE